MRGKDSKGLARQNGSFGARSRPFSADPAHSARFLETAWPGQEAVGTKVIATPFMQ